MQSGVQLVLLENAKGNEIVLTRLRACKWKRKNDAVTLLKLNYNRKEKNVKQQIVIFLAGKLRLLAKKNKKIQKNGISRSLFKGQRLFVTTIETSIEPIRTQEFYVASNNCNRGIK